jgi:protocatechuate 3,4-dioxygenase beta subunit
MDHHDHDHHHVAIHDRGLQFDVSTVLRRRGMLGLLAGAGLATLVGCGSGGTDGSGNGTATGTASPTASATGGASPGTASCGSEIPQETAGPYPGDGSNGPNVLTQSGIVRSDIRSSIGSASGVAEGVPLTINLTILDAAKGCAAYAGAAVYLWQCDMDGGYSMYTGSVRNENYLRGVQAADGSGLVTFRSVFPGAYSGRWPHIHFEVYPTLASATAARSKITTSQLALPEAVCREVYATSGYATSVRNLAQTSLASDNVFRDDRAARQLAAVTGDVSAGVVASLAVPVAT